MKRGKKQKVEKGKYGNTFVSEQHPKVAVCVRCKKDESVMRNPVGARTSLCKVTTLGVAGPRIM
jgi:hypothetical protein